MHIDLIASVVSAWAGKHKSISRVWLFGSRVRGDHRDDSDIDIAVEVIAPSQDFDCLSVWIEERPKLLSSISSQLPMPVHLEWYGGQIETPTIDRGLLRSSLIVFERMSNSDGTE
ncbi:MULTISPECIES: nucleotidyltransferase family protein [unclassified Pseudomonas]|uniref:nucleotidyltransferase family protein n=1 Tax=unclassified Pseudomonas TaxID=196821 RepID=UPI000C7B67AA|nr:MULTISPECIES: nucleotidyltransferase domain-containing protein [unclassified Pseudomonas]